MLCQCPKLSPLQSRLLASLSALVLVALVCWSLSSPHFAYAAELSHDGSGQERKGEDHNWHRTLEDALPEEKEDNLEDKTTGTGRKAERRDSASTQFQGNNIATPYDASAGSLTLWEYPNNFLIQNHVERVKRLPSDFREEEEEANNPPSKHPELRKRVEEDLLHGRQDGSTTIYFSGNTCAQPTWNGTGIQTAAPPQLTLYVSNNADNKDLGPGKNNQEYPFMKGAVNASVPSASGSWYVAVGAPSLPRNFSGSWNYRLAASIDDYFYSVNYTTDALFLVDTDSDSALLVTNNLTQDEPSSTAYQQWANMSAPFNIFAVNNNLTGMMGIENSYCGLQTLIANNSQDGVDGDGNQVQMQMITRGLGNKPKQQFHITSLKDSTEYTTFLAMKGNETGNGNGVVGGGGMVWNDDVTFTTKTDGNCQLLYNLTFCDEVAYAVPANPLDLTLNISNFYDNYTQFWWQFFNGTLAQIPCNTTSDAQYSLARNCDDCAAAYKEWLCAVSIPRCQDFSSTDTFLQPRNMGQGFYTNGSMLPDERVLAPYTPMSRAPSIQGSMAFSQTYISSFATNQSRNAQIDAVIRPGPYKEVLPCDDLCYNLMQSCPASMNLACPYPGRGLEVSYGKRGPGLQCNYLGAVYVRSDASGRLSMAVAWRALASAGAAALTTVFM